MSELERLRDRIAELEDAMGLTAVIPAEIVPREIFTGQTYGKPKVQAVIGILLARPFGHKAAIYDALYGSLPECDQPQPQILSVYLCRVRAALRIHGIRLKTIRSPGMSGWYIDEADKAKLRAVISCMRGARAFPVTDGSVAQPALASHENNREEATRA